MPEQSLRPSAAAQVLAYVGETISIMNYVRNTKFKMADENCETQRIAAEQAGIAAYNDAYNQGEATQLQAWGQIASAGVSLGGDALSYAGTSIYAKVKENDLNNQLKNVESWENTLSKSSHDLYIAPANGRQDEEMSAKDFFNGLKQNNLVKGGPNSDEINQLNLHVETEEFEKFEKRIEKLKDNLNSQKERNEQKSIRNFDQLQNLFRNVGSAVTGGFGVKVGDIQKDGAAFKMAIAIWDYVKNTLGMLESQFYDSASKDTDSISSTIHSVDAIYDTNKA